MDRVRARISARAAAGAALVLALIAMPVIPRVRPTDAATPSTGTLDPRRQTQIARIPRWREIRRAARARTQSSPGASPAPPDSAHAPVATHPTAS